VCHLGLGPALRYTAPVSLEAGELGYVSPAMGHARYGIGEGPRSSSTRSDNAVQRASASGVVLNVLLGALSLL
jgi:hypothetical protein